MAAVYDFKIMVAAKLTRALNRLVMPADCTFGPAIAVNVGNKDTKVMVTVGENTYPIVYNRYDVAKLVPALYNGLIIDEMWAKADVITAINLKFGLNLKEIDVQSIDYVDGYSGRTVTVTIADVSKPYKGKFIIPYFRPNDLPQPYYHVAVKAGDYGNRGNGPATLNPAIPSFEHDGKTFFGAGGTALGTMSLGTGMSMAGDFTVDFEMLASSIGNVYGILFKSSSAGNGANPARGDLFTGRDLSGKMNCAVLYAMGYGSSADIKTTAYSATKPLRHTIVRKGGVVKWYENGALVWTFTDGYAFSWSWLDMTRPVAAFRNLRYWQYALTDDKLAILLSQDDSKALAYSYSLQGSQLSDIYGAFSFPIKPTNYVTVEGQTMAAVSAGAFDSITMDITNDFTLSVDVKVTSDKYTTLFARHNAAAAPGALMFYYGAPYMANWGNSGAVIPSPRLDDGKKHNLQIRCLNGIVSIIVDGVTYDTFTNPGNGAPWTGIGDLNTFSAGWPAGAAISNLRFWRYGLSDADLLVQRMPNIRQPLHHWPLDGVKTNLGRGATPWLGDFTWTEFNGETWGAVPSTTNAVDIGVNLPIDRDFTVDFFLVANSIGNAYGDIFKMVPGAWTTGDLVTWRTITVDDTNKPSLQSLGATVASAVKTSKLVDDAVNRMTIKRVGDVWTIYQDGTFRWEFTAAHASGFWRYFGSMAKRSKEYLKNMRYWEYGLTDIELTALFRK